jgi:hypothetical protein
VTTPIQAGQAVPGPQSSDAGVLADLAAQASATQEAEAELATVIGEAQASDPAVAATAAADPAAVSADATVVADVTAVDP